MRDVPGWHTYNMDLAAQAATRSKDPNTQVGAYIVDSNNIPAAFGYNGFPTGIEETIERWGSICKHNWVIHAEINAILNAAKSGKKVEGCTLYTTLFPCSKCALLICQAGISEVYYREERGGYDQKLSEDIFDECGVFVGGLE